MLRTFLLLCLLIICSLSFSQHRLAINGSSTAACGGSSNNNFCWVYLFMNHQALQGQPVTLLNTAAYGENIYHCMPTGYIPPAGRPSPNLSNNITNSLNWNPDVVLINYPSNWYDVYTVAEVMACFRTIRTETQNAGKVLYVTTTQPRTGFTAAGRERLRILKDSIIEQFGLYAINFWDGIANPADNTILPEYRYCCDDIHLNDAAHQILFERVRDKNIFSSQSSLPLYAVQLNARLYDKTIKIEAFIDGTDLFEAELQRSIDGLNFNSVHRFMDLNPNKTKYTYEDRNPLSGNNYYRLRITETNGKVTYSQPKLVKVHSQDFVIEKIVTTAANVLQIYFSKAINSSGGIYNVSVTSTAGSLILNRSFAMDFSNPSRLQIALPSCSPGVYLLRLTTGEGKVVTGKFLIR